MSNVKCQMSIFFSILYPSFWLDLNTFIFVHIKFKHNNFLISSLIMMMILKKQFVNNIYFIYFFGNKKLKK